jgi:proteasome assembly chaperone (PAC2) family protein
MQIVSLRMSNPNKPQDSSLVFNVYPNPTQDYITIEGDLENGANQASVFIYDLKGAIVQKDIYYGTKKTYSLTGYTTGIYFLEIKYSTKQSSNYRILITQ